MVVRPTGVLIVLAMGEQKTISQSTLRNVRVHTDMANLRTFFDLATRLEGSRSKNLSNSRVEQRRFTVAGIIVVILS